MLAYKDKKQCAGCTACMNICPHNAISMQADREGFLYPVTDEDLCTDCGLCQKICPFQNINTISGNYTQPKVYAVKHRDDNVRMNSTSGGMFTAISDYILSKDGVIYGAGFDEQFRVCHQKAENVEDRNKLRGSKYVQSDLQGVFKDIKEELKKGRQVLFTGTPCQTAGLHAYLSKKYENLYLCDLVCHGTPSPLMWKEHVDFMVNRRKKIITAYDFRSKWRGINVSIAFEDGSFIHNSTDLLTYTNIFYSHVALRPSCYHCQFTNYSRPSDITIADFWGIEKCMPDFDDDKGVSLVLVNSPKGLELFQKIKIKLDYRESNTTDCVQRNLCEPSEPSPLREQFWQDYWSKGFKYVLKRYAGYGGKSRAKIFIRNGLEKVGLLPIVKRLLQ